MSLSLMYYALGQDLNDMPPQQNSSAIASSKQHGLMLRLKFLLFPPQQQHKNRITKNIHRQLHPQRLNPPPQQPSRPSSALPNILLNIFTSVYIFARCCAYNNLRRLKKMCYAKIVAKEQKFCLNG